MFDNKLINNNGYGRTIFKKIKNGKSANVKVPIKCRLIGLGARWCPAARLAPIDF